MSVDNYRELVGRLYPRERHSPDEVAKLVVSIIDDSIRLILILILTLMLILMWQASLKGLSGAASYIDSSVHVGLLSPVS